jgi:hypothetical protein
MKSLKKMSLATSCDLLKTHMKLECSTWNLPVILQLRLNQNHNINFLNWNTQSLQPTQFKYNATWQGWLGGNTMQLSQGDLGSSLSGDRTFSDLFTMLLAMLCPMSCTISRARSRPISRAMSHPKNDVVFDITCNISYSMSCQVQQYQC